MAQTRKIEEATFPRVPDENSLTGRNRRLLHEWRQLHLRTVKRRDVDCSVLESNAFGLPVKYLVVYNIRSVCGIENPDASAEAGAASPPLFASRFEMLLEIPEAYPCVDAPPRFRFLTEATNGQAIPHPWHPNIRFFGEFAGRVCLNFPDTWTDLAWGVERVASYLRYDLYNAVQEPPYPEDLKVAQWTRKQGEPNGWIFFDQEISPVYTSNPTRNEYDDPAE
ncbi:MAG: hypothetical protein LBR26_04355 [Prevotella sp.]|jgi:hypothetical protein|nr:hypothetical protein [Prevotella sp.]